MRFVAYSPRDHHDAVQRSGLLIAADCVVSMARVAEVMRLHQLGGADLEVSSINRMLDAGSLEAVLAFGRLMRSDRSILYLLRESGVSPQDCRFAAPLRPGKLITVARNYRDHLAESGVSNIGPVPSASIKATSVVSGPYDDVVRPTRERQLDYETELAVVVGCRCKNVSARDAYQVIAGYMVMNDIVAREVLSIERRAGNQFLGKMFDGFAPLGPALVTKEDVQEPMSLKIQTRVNGEIRQSGNTRDMIWSIPQLIEYFSQTTLEPGDVISTGTPAGVAAGRKAGEASWFLEPGDIVEAEIEGVGTLRNSVTQDPVAGQWEWGR